MCEIFCLHRIWISEDLPTAAEDCQIFRKTSEDRQRFPMTSKDCWRFPDGFQREQKCVDRFSTTSKQGQRFWKDFQPISSIIKEFRRCSDNFSSVFKQLIIIIIMCECVRCQLLSVRHKKLVWMCYITVLDLQAWCMRVGRYMHESLQVWSCLEINVSTHEGTSPCHIVSATSHRDKSHHVIMNWRFFISKSSHMDQLWSLWH